MERKTFALYTLIAGAVVGIAADLLFYGKLIGVSFPLFMLISMRRRAGLGWAAAQRSTAQLA